MAIASVLRWLSAVFFLGLPACGEAPAETAMRPGQTGQACPLLPAGASDAPERVVDRGAGPHGVSDSGPGELHTACEALCRRRMDCGPEIDVAGCIGSCVERLDRYRVDAVVMVADCLVAGGCDADEGVCISMIPPLEIHLTYVRACRRKGTECGWSCERIESWCNVEGGAGAASYLLFPPSRMEAALACLQNPCERTCLLAKPRRPVFP